MANLAGLPNPLATCSYNGVAFLTGYKSHVSSRPMLDDAERTTVYVEHTLTVDGYVSASPATTDATLATMRKLLTACGGALNYSSKGFGSLVVNVGQVRDARWGPIPEILEWVPLGGDCNAAKVTWRCVTRIPECDFAHYQFALLAFNYEVAFDIDDSGYTTFRVGGYIEIPMTRVTQSNRSLPDHIDRYRPLLFFPVAPGFQRKTQSYRVSKDKRRADFQIVDEEVPSPLPDGATHVEARHTLESHLHKAADGVGAFRFWRTRIEATITLARGVPKTDAWAIFLLILNSRLGQTNIPLKPPLQIPQRLSCEDDVFGRTARISAEFTGFKNYDISQAINSSTIWQAVIGTGYSKWQASLAPFNTTGTRGWAGIQNDPGSDVIVDLCLQVNPPTSVYPRPPITQTKEPKSKKPLEAGPKLKNLDEDSSWVTYRPRILNGEKTGVIRHKPLPPPPPSTSGPAGGIIRTPNASLTATKLAGAPAMGDDQAVTRANAPLSAADTSSNYRPDVFQRAASPTRTIVFSGEAVRIGFRIPVPKIESVGGVPCVELGRTVIEAEPTSIGSVLFFALAWQIEYALASAPSGPYPYPANPALGTDGGTGTSSTLTADV